MTQPITPQVLRSRAIREAILRSLHVLFQASPGLWLGHGHILRGFAGSRARYTEEQITGELINLIDDELVEQQNAPTADALPDKEYCITKGGRDFKAAGFPWMKIDEFTGGQSL